MKKSAKEQYAGLDVSLKSVSVCVSDGVGKVQWRGEVANEPSEVGQVLSRRAPNLVRAVIETGSCGIYLMYASHVCESGLTYGHLIPLKDPPCS